MSITPITLTGTSQYSSDFQSILNRAVQVAQLPVTALQNKDSDVLAKKTLLSGLNSAANSLAEDLQALGTTASSNALTATSSDATTVSVANTGSTTAASYTINSVTSTASAASERSVQGYGDSTSTPVSATGSLNLTVGSHTYGITLTNNSLIGLRDAINGLVAGVTATILTTGNGNYLSVSSNTTGATTLALNDDPSGANTSLLTNTNQGTNAVFELNGISVSQKSNVVSSVIPGVTFSILKPSTTPVTLSLQSDSSQLSSTLQKFVGDYNTLQSQVQAQRGAGAGLLLGDSVVNGLQSILSQIASYHSGTSSVNNLASLGVTFNADGTASFDSSALSSLNSSQLSDALQFIGSSTSGLAQFSRSLTQYSDPISGLIQIEQNGLNNTDKSIQSQISTLTDRINALQTSLSQRLAKADALQSELQSQQQGLTASLQGLNVVLYGKSPNS